MPIPALSISSMTPLTASSGDVITITGTGFYYNLKVFVGGVQSPFVTQTGNTTLTFTIGNGASGYVNIVRLDPAGVITSVQSIDYITVTQVQGLVTKTAEQYYENGDLGNYQYISLDDIVNNFLVAYVGDGKLIDTARTSDVLFHAKRGLQEFSYDVLNSFKSIEVEVPINLSIPFPQDYVNYVKLTFVDSDGVERLIHPTRLTSTPTQSILQSADPQDNFDGDYVYDEFGNLVLTTSIIEDRWKAITVPGIVDYDTDRNYPVGFGVRYGAIPEHANLNGVFVINDREGNFTFSSDLVGRVVIIKYISDGLGNDFEMRINKMAEEALYMHIIWAILSTRSNVQEYVVNRYKRERRNAIRNAKIRLSKIKSEELAQVMRNKSKQIKH
jgi:hypothetical protein